MEESDLSGLKHKARNVSYLYRVAMVFAAAPLVFGLFLFLLWLVSQDNDIALLGFLTIIAGLISVSVALVLFLVYLVIAIYRKMPTGRVIASFFFGLFLILVNFPIAFACISIADYIMSTYILTVENSSASGISDIHITGPGIDTQIGTLNPGETQVLRFHIKGDGELVFSANASGNELSGIIEDYVTGGPIASGDKKLIFTNNNEYEVKGRAQIFD